MVQWLSDQWFWLRRACARHSLNAAVGLVLVYFLVHGMQGERGWFARQNTLLQLQERDQELSELVSKREALEDRVEALKPGSAQTDMVEQELYRLGYIKPGDVIIYRKDLIELTP